jgi:Tfp pilus assembly protein PilO
MDFESLLKVVVAVVILVAVPVAAYAAIMATRAIWGRPQHPPAAELEDELEALRTRVGELEVQAGRVAELEERVDFAERLLSQRREAERLPER